MTAFGNSNLGKEKITGSCQMTVSISILLLSPLILNPATPLKCLFFVLIWFDGKRFLLPCFLKIMSLAIYESISLKQRPGTDLH